MLVGGCVQSREVLSRIVLGQVGVINKLNVRGGDVESTLVAAKSRASSGRWILLIAHIALKVMVLDRRLIDGSNWWGMSEIALVDGERVVDVLDLLFDVTLRSGRLLAHFS